VVCVVGAEPYCLCFREMDWGLKKEKGGGEVPRSECVLVPG
jgi:hypothetical protein